MTFQRKWQTGSNGKREGFLQKSEEGLTWHAISDNLKVKEVPMTNKLTTEILLHRLEALKESVAHLAKIAAKVEAPAPEIVIVDRYEKPYHDDETGADLIETWLKIEILNAYPVLEGDWKFVAAIDHIAEGVNITRIAPDFRDQDFSHLQQVDSKCDHCKVNRNRNHTFLFQDSEGKMMQVGSTCMTDFLGHQLKFQWLEWIDEFSDDQSIFGRSSGGGSRFSVLDLLVAAHRLISVYGFHKADSESPTKNLMNNFLMSPRFFENIPKITEEGMAEVKAAVEWIKSEDYSSDYISNLKIVIEHDRSDSRYHGLIASLIPAYRRHLGLIVERAAREVEVKVPVVTGEKVQITGVVVNVALKETEWGYREVMTVKDDRGFKVWGTRPAKISDCSIGDKVTFIANIEASTEDECFGFYKRPSKVTIEYIDNPVH